MTTAELLQKFEANHLALIDYINALPVEQFEASNNNKWTPGQQLSHIYLCLDPLVKSVGAKTFIAHKFGKIDRPVWSYQQVQANYTQALNKGGKAPTRFVPEPVAISQKEQLNTGIKQQVADIVEQLKTYSEDELDTLVLPHPLLGKMTIREMFYLMADHATHHLNQTKLNLQSATLA